jgi:hypothetical protein
MCRTGCGGMERRSMTEPNRPSEEQLGARLSIGAWDGPVLPYLSVPNGVKSASKIKAL